MRHFWPYRTGAMQDPGYELPRIPLLRTRVNKKLGTEGEGEDEVRYYRQRQDDQPSPNQQRYHLVLIHLAATFSVRPDHVTSVS
jgi:hypothetical protein